MRLRFELEADQLYRAFNKLDRDIEKKISQNFDRTEIVEEVKRNVPVQTGQLKRSVRADKKISKAKARQMGLVKISAPYAAKVNKRRRFVEKSLNNQKGNIKREMRKAVGKVLRSLGL